MNKQGPSQLQQILSDGKAVQQLAGSREARELAQLLSQSRDQASLQQMARDAARGDTRQLSELIRAVTDSPGGAQLLQKLQQTLSEQ